MVKIGWTSGVLRKKDVEKMAKFEEAGMNWWLESLYGMTNYPKKMLRRIRIGPPKSV